MPIQPLFLELLGGVDLRVGDETLTAGLPKKAIALLAYLALTGRPHTRQSLASLLWGESPEESARVSLRTALWLMGRPLSLYLLVTRQTVAFNPASPHHVDAAEFVRRVTRGLEAVGARTILNETQAADLRAAVDLYRGELLAGWPVYGAPAFEEWLVAERQRLLGLALRALYHLSAHYTRQGAYEEAIGMVRRLLELEPWQEEAHRQLMQLLALVGRRSEALMQYKACRRVLVLELGTEPTLETQAIYQEILAAERRGRRRSAGSVGWQAPSPGQRLPPLPAPLVGRESESAQLKRLVLNPEYRLVTVVGAGGAGKTSLALAVADNLREHFPEGVWFVPLADPPRPQIVRVSRGPAEGLAAALGQVLGLTPVRSRDLLAQAASFLEQRRCLLVLDGFEACLADQGLLADLLALAPGLCVLVTCRQRLGLRSEATLRIAGLPAPTLSGADGLAEDDADVQSLIAAPSVQLLIDRATRVNHDFALNRDAAFAAAKICQLASGLPLAIELAARQAADVSLPEVAAMLRDEPERLTAPWPDAPARHRSLLACFQHSWRLLTDQEQEALVRLSPLAGPFGPDVAASRGVSLPELRALADRSLLERPALGWFTWAPFVRQFAALAAGGRLDTAC